MARRRFLVDKFESGRAVLAGEQGHHLARVLRAQPGQVYEISDGATVWLARVESLASERVEFELMEEVDSRESESSIALLVSIIKFGRFEWILEKAAEFGVSFIVPLAASRSEKHLVRAAAGRAARWEKILLNASQQARRLAPPVLSESLTPGVAFAGAAARVPASVRLLLSERSDAPLLRTHLAGSDSPPANAVLALGPQGGWTTDELRAATDAGFAEVSLGGTVLRAETASLSALAILSHELAIASRDEN